MNTTSKKLKILVVDDSAMTRKLISKELTADGYEVVEAADGLDALVKATSGRPPDLITLDVEMPRLNGFETCRKLRESHYSRFFTNYPSNQVPIIFITSLDTLDERKKGFTNGATDFITKPFAKGEILKAVNQVLRPEKRMEGLTVLAVDDNRVALQIVAMTLRQEGVNLIEAKNGQEAYEIVCKRMSDIDLVLTDLMMPIMNGDELCVKIRQELGMKDIPIIFLTAVEDQSQILNLFKVGANDYLIKPFVKEELIARLEGHLQRAQLNKDLRTNILELQDLNRMKDDLIAVCSHDLRSPLNGILGFTDLLLEKEYLAREDQENLIQVKNSGEFLLSLVNDILDLSKSQAEESELETEPLVMNTVVTTSVKALHHLTTSKNQQLTYDDQSDDTVVLGNKSGLIRVFNNLLSNAIKFTPENKKIQISMEREKDFLVIRVVDQGIGIPRDKIPFLFDKYSKTSRSGTSGEKGTGLGMSIIKEIVEKHAGSVDVESDEGKGSSFIIRLPVAPPETRPEILNPVQAEVCSIAKELRILVAEDNPVNSKLAAKFLEKEHHLVTVARNGREAIDLAATNTFDLIFMDMHMPEVDGLEATREIRNQEFKGPIIALTGSTTEKSLEACKIAGMNDFQTKPFKAKDLVEKINTWCRSCDS